jgi:tricorn protease
MHRAFRFAWLPLVVAFAGSACAEQDFLTKPDIHGDWVVFTAEGDLWLGSISQHAARRITSDPGTETNARFSPDGKTIAFTAQYDGGNDVYKMPVDGGPPQRLTFDPAQAEVQGWTPDGSAVIFRSRRGNPFDMHLFEVPMGGGTPKQLPVPRAEFGSLAPSGILAYVPESFEWANWFHYKGGGADKIWLANLNTHKFTKLTDYEGVDTTPVWCGDRIYFVSERSGWSNLWEYDMRTKGLKQCTHYSDAPVRYPSSDGHRIVFQHGAHVAMFDPAGDQVTELSFDMSSDRVHSRQQRVPLASQVNTTVMVQNGGGISLGPTGKRILIEARGQIVSVAATAGDMRVLEDKQGSRARFPVWSPDGKRFAFISDRSGENELWIGDAAGGSDPKQLTHGLATEPFPPIWSPDGKWLALFDHDERVLLVDAATGVAKTVDQADEMSSYDTPTGTARFSPDSKLLAFSRPNSNWLNCVELYEISSGRKQHVTDWRINSYMPVFDATGKFLLFLSDNNMAGTSVPPFGQFGLSKLTHVEMLPLLASTPSPFLPKNDDEGVVADQKQKADAKAEAKPAPSVVDWDNMTARIIQTPMDLGLYTLLDAAPGKILALSYDATSFSGPPGPGSFRLVSFDLESRETTTLAEGIDAFQLSGDQKKVLLIAPGRRISVHDLGAPASSNTGLVDLSPYTLAYDPEQEWRQIFEESWRVGRDFYYDPNMHGLDWDAIRKKYEARLSMVGDRRDLSRLLADMVSELSTGHAYIGDPSPRGPGSNLGFLGIDAESVPGMDAVRITKLLRGDPFDLDVASPLLEPGMNVKEGDYILEIAGQPVTRDKDFESLLIGTRGQTVAIMVNDKPSRDGARVIRVRPLASEYDLRYEDWVMGRTKYVEEHGGPDFGYCHLPDMENGGIAGFLKGQTADTFKSAMIYDTRYNGGGYISSLVLQDIASRPTNWFKPRHGSPWTREGWANIGHRVAICNEGNFSDGELFIVDWEYMGLGPVVGTRTGGGEVGSGGGYALIDGGTIYIPAYGAYRGNEWLVEGKGAVPTVPVEQDPNEVMAGRDPQLDKAIELMKAELAKDPVSVPQHPPFRVMPKPGG